MRRQPLERKITALVGKCIRDFELPIASPVAVALSGGKDSTALALSLRALGFDVVPMIVDMGYAGFDAQEVASTAHTLGFAPMVIAADDHTTVALPTQQRTTVEANLASLRDAQLRTPCGLCSQTKRILLFRAALGVGAKVVGFGHHREDLAVTLLKDFFVNRYHATLGAYERRRFADFVASEPLDLDALRQMILCGTASTMSVQLHDPCGVALTRPLAFVAEEDIREWISEQKVPVFGSGCSHSVFVTGGPETATKREIVHSEWIKRLRAKPALGPLILSLALSSLSGTGLSLSNPRASRQERLRGFEGTT